MHENMHVKILQKYSLQFNTNTVPEAPSVHHQDSEQPIALHRRRLLTSFLELSKFKDLLLYRLVLQELLNLSMHKIVHVCLSN